MRDAPVAALRLARLDSQRLSDSTRLGADPVAVARAVCGVQAQDLAAGLLSLRVRAAGLTEAATRRAFEVERTLARTWLMRGTLHLVAADDLRLLLVVYGPLNERRDATRRAQVGLDDAVCDRAIRAICRALAGGPLTRHELRERLADKGVVVPPGQAMVHLLALAASRGVLTLTEQRGRFNTFMLLDDVVPRERRLPSLDRAEAELVRRYFAAYGPATVGDFAYWSGLPMSAARRAVAAALGSLEELAGPLPGLLRCKRGVDGTEASRPVVRLLPYFDTYLLGYKQRDVMIERERAMPIYNGGWINPTLCVDGRLTGTWRLARGRDADAVEVVPFAPLSRGVVAGMRAEVNAIGSFFRRATRLVA